jgi:hypothetical protein
LGLGLGLGFRVRGLGVGFRARVRANLVGRHVVARELLEYEVEAEPLDVAVERL